MAVIRGLVRAAAYALGALFVVSGILDILGFMPYSNETPPWRARLLSELPVLAGAAVLLVPMKSFTRGGPHTVLKIAYVLLILATAANLVDGVRGYVAGRMSWHVIPASLVLAAIVVANAIVLWSMRERSSALA
jgi:uncharacterized membrane protein HdeD (DUF308 family)